MYMDNELIFDNDVAHLTTEASAAYIDFKGPRNLGIGEDLFVVAIVTTAFTDSSSNSTMALTLETDDNSSFSTATTTLAIGTFAALAAIGDRLIKKLSPGDINERYCRVKYTVANGDLSTGKFKTFITKDPDNYVAYPDGFAIQ